MTAPIRHHEPLPGSREDGYDAFRVYLMTYVPAQGAAMVYVGYEADVYFSRWEDHLKEYNKGKGHPIKRSIIRAILDGHPMAEFVYYGWYATQDEAEQAEIDVMERFQKMDWIVGNIQVRKGVGAARKSQEKKNADFDKMLEKRNPDFERVGNYIRQADKLLVRRRECGHEQEKYYSDLYSGCGCKVCREEGRQKRSPYIPDPQPEPQKYIYRTREVGWIHYTAAETLYPAASKSFDSLEHCRQWLVENPKSPPEYMMEYALVLEGEENITHQIFVDNYMIEDDAELHRTIEFHQGRKISDLTRINPVTLDEPVKFVAYFGILNGWDEATQWDEFEGRAWSKHAAVRKAHSLSYGWGRDYEGFVIEIDGEIFREACSRIEQWESWRYSDNIQWAYEQEAWLDDCYDDDECDDDWDD